MPIRDLSPELQIIAENDLNEVPSKILDDLTHIREWLAQQPHLNARIDNQWLLSFLRGCKFDLKKTKKKLDIFYTARTLVPEFFADRDPLLPNIQELLTLGTCIVLPKSSDSTSKATILIRHTPVDCKQIHIMDVLKLVLMIIDILLIEDDNCTVAGIVAIEDMKGIPFTHLLQMTPSNSKKTVSCFQTAYPIRPKQIHFLNSSTAFESVYKIVRLFLTEKLRNRINIYNQNYAEVLQRTVSPDVLPSEYGGNAGPLDDMIGEWKRKVESYRDWFLEDAKYCSDESKRPRKAKTPANGFGIYKWFVSKFTGDK